MGKHVLINLGELHYWQFFNPIGEEIFEESFLPPAPLIHLFFGMFLLHLPAVDTCIHNGRLLSLEMLLVIPKST